MLGQDFGPGEPSSEVIDLARAIASRSRTRRWPATLAPDGAHVVAVDPTGSTLTVWDTELATVTASAKLADFEIDLLIGGLVARRPLRAPQSPQRIVRASMPDLRMIASAQAPTPASPVPRRGAGDRRRHRQRRRRACSRRHDVRRRQGDGASAADEPLVNVVVSADGSTVVAQAVDAGTYEVFDASTLSPIAEPLAGAGPVTRGTPPPVISADGTMIAVLRARPPAHGLGHRPGLVGGIGVCDRRSQPHPVRVGGLHRTGRAVPGDLPPVAVRADRRQLSC